jgi:hypothetical protein
MQCKQECFPSSCSSTPMQRAWQQREWRCVKIGTGGTRGYMLKPHTARCTAAKPSSQLETIKISVRGSLRAVSELDNSMNIFFGV